MSLIYIGTIKTPDLLIKVDASLDAGRGMVPIETITAIATLLLPNGSTEQFHTAIHPTHARSIGLARVALAAIVAVCQFKEFSGPSELVRFNPDFTEANDYPTITDVVMQNAKIQRSLSTNTVQ